jgi:dihydrofolate synthase / folylpolyglutamate synthase
MKIRSIKTSKILPFEQDIFSVLDKYLIEIPERSILAITSKIVAICEGNVVKKGETKKDGLIEREADLYLPKRKNKYDYLLTIKNGVLLPSAGIDESNGNGYYILWPKDSQKSANQILDYLKIRFGRQKIGVVITDSRTTPLRWGTTGVAIAYSGFMPLRDYIGQPDIFGVRMRATKANIMDALAVAAVLVMGEGEEQTPLALIEEIPFMSFQKNHPTKKELQELNISLDDDLYSELLRSVNWRQSRKKD